MRPLPFDDACGIKRQHHCLTIDGTNRQTCTSCRDLVLAS
jgi:hypothetical protein